MTLVWEHAPCRENALIVLLALADWANDDGVSWPSIQKLADKARIDRRSAQRIVRRLQKDQIITIQEGGGRSKQHSYQIETAALCRPLAEINSDFPDTETAALRTQRATFPTQTATPVSPDPLVDPLVDPSRDTLSSNAQFFNNLKTNPSYSHINFDHETGKMQAWLSLPANKGRKMTPRFVLNWLNKIERPLTVPTNGKRKHVDVYVPNETLDVCQRCMSTGVEVTEKGARPCNHQER